MLASNITTIDIEEQQFKDFKMIIKLLEK